MERWVSPNDLLQAARKNMLEGHEPESHDDWVLVVNFMSANIDPKVQPGALYLIAKIYKMPLDESEISEICKFQEHTLKEVITT